MSYVLGIIILAIDITNVAMPRFTSLDDFCKISKEYSAPTETLRSLEQINIWWNDEIRKTNKILELLRIIIWELFN